MASVARPHGPAPSARCCVCTQRAKITLESTLIRWHRDAHGGSAWRAHGRDLPRSCRSRRRRSAQIARVAPHASHLPLHLLLLLLIISWHLHKGFLPLAVSAAGSRSQIHWGWSVRSTRSVRPSLRFSPFQGRLKRFMNVL
jgi:hypothetical protein